MLRGSATLMLRIMQNVELKAELRDPLIAREVCKQMGGTLVGVMHQTDTYYRIPAGRLKKRETKHGQPDVGGATGAPGTTPPEQAEIQVEYIFYDRPNTTAAKVSRFTIYNESGFQERFGREPLPVLVQVRKTRTLYMIDNTRIHLDSVEGLGNFIEFEYFVSKKQSREDGHAFLSKLKHEFRFALGELIDRSYSDLLLGS